MSKRIMIEEVRYGGWKKNLRISDSRVELIIPLDVGIRVIHFGFLKGKNVFKVFKEQIGGSGEAEWCSRGGHRFWTAPEEKHSYDLDNQSIQYRILKSNIVELIQRPSLKFGFEKTVNIQFGTKGLIKLTHVLRNTGKKTLHVSPWTLTVMDTGGTAIIPQPPRVPHPMEFSKNKKPKPEDFWPNRRLILWPYTNFSDPRYAFKDDAWFIRQDRNRGATKFGYLHQLGWVYYKNDQTIFAKHVDYKSGSKYPDDGCNFELFTNQDFLELESLAPVKDIPPGGVVEHVEYWALLKAKNWLKTKKLRQMF